MRKRLQELMDKEGISPARFAELVGVQRSSVSHILSGRNNPSLEFIQKILSAFPKINSDWLISDIGSIYRTSNQGEPVQLSSGQKVSIQPATDLFSALNEEDLPTYKTSEEAKTKPGKAPHQIIDKPNEFHTSQEEKVMKPFSESKKIRQIVVFYSDDTFKVYHPDK